MEEKKEVCEENEAARGGGSAEAEQELSHSRRLLKLGHCCLSEREVGNLRVSPLNSRTVTA